MRAGRRLLHEGGAKVVAQDLQRRVDTLQTSLVVGLRLLEGGVLRSAGLLSVGLLCSGVLHLIGEGGNLALQLGNAGLGEVEAGGQLGDLGVVLVLLGVGFSSLRVAEGLRRSLLRRLLLETCHHVLNQSLDLGKGIGRSCGRGADAHGEHRQLAVLGVPAQGHHLGDHVAVGIHGLRGHLHQTICLALRSPGLVRQHLRRRVQSVNLVGPRGHGSVPLVGPLLAVVVGLVQGLGIPGQLLLGQHQISGSGGQSLFRVSLHLLGLLLLPSLRGQLVLHRLLHHGKIVLGLALSAICVGFLRLRLAQEVLQGAHDAV
mmetsp:Transcript_25860/g.66709  ORF Transcript_25860/g.66709 Transcript_25860/m.66709 type:complete len:316 (-) Transcript_25860:728-1675(-)